MTRLFPLSIAALSIGACVVYFLAGDYRRAVYWFCAATMTVAVTKT